MKITPLEIRQKTFEKVFRGYDKDEVHAFLQTLSHEWEKIYDDYKEVKMRFDNAEKEIVKLREVEGSLYKTLKTAEDTGANMIEQAKKTAELHVREANIKAEGLMSEAKSMARNTLEEAESKSRDIIDDMEDQVKELMQVYRRLEHHRENLLSDLKNISSDTLDKVDRAAQQRSKYQIEDFWDKAKEISLSKNSLRISSQTDDFQDRESTEENDDRDTEASARLEQQREQEEKEKREKHAAAEEAARNERNKNSGSFFDEID